MDHTGATFLCGCAPFTHFIFFAQEIDDLMEQGTPNSSFFVMDDDSWEQYDTSVGWPAISMATVKPIGGKRTVVAISPQGDFWEVETSISKERTGSIKKPPGHLRSLAVVDQVFYACGMGRTVLMRNTAGNWTSIGPPTTPDVGDSVVGFEDLAGYSSKEIYAVGWQGEIWIFEKSRWRQLDSPVSANFNAVCCAEDGNVYIVGDNGSMLRGRGDSWSVLDTGIGLNLMDVAFHEGDVYVVTDFHILKLEGDTLVQDDQFADPGDRPATCLYLMKAEDGLVSMGPKDLFRRQAGSWERLV